MSASSMVINRTVEQCVWYLALCVDGGVCASAQTISEVSSGCRTCFRKFSLHVTSVQSRPLRDGSAANLGLM